MKIKIINKSGYDLPEYKTKGSAGCDLHAVLEYPKKLLPLDRVTIPTGIYLALPTGYEAQVRPRSGLAAKFGVTAILGTIDADYRGEIKTILVNLSNEDYTVQPGERIAQLVIIPFVKALFSECENLSDTVRGSDGFGSTGVK